ncbi:MAG: hypothetical protein JXN59_10850 [Anaerolineae bacterium]|nr:hypothetical protein [Anaerolineae bacterium]
MPRYNYTCHTCTRSFEVRLSYAEVDSARPACPDCGGADCERGLNRVNMAVAANGGSDYRLTRGDLETAIGMSNAMSGAASDGHSHGGSCGCGSCGGGNCGTCSH